MTDTPQVTRLVAALGVAQAAAGGADRASVADALKSLEDAWAACPAEALDVFDRANLQLARSTLQQLLELDNRDSIGEAVRLARLLGPEQEDQHLLVQVLLEAGNSARQAGDFDSARPLIDEALERARAALGLFHEETAQAYNCLGLWGRYRGEFDLARRAYLTALRIVGPTAELRAGILHNLASLEHLAGQPESALELIETALSLRDDDAARDADEAVRAAILIDCARYAEAAELFGSLAIRLDHRWGHDSTEMMHLNANWAVLEQRRDNLDGARDRCAQAIAVAERRYGSGSPEAAVIYANAAHLAHSSGRRDEAAGYAKRAVLGLEGRASADLPSLRLARQVRDALDA